MRKLAKVVLQINCFFGILGAIGMVVGGFIALFGSIWIIEGLYVAVSLFVGAGFVALNAAACFGFILYMNDVDKLKKTQ